MANLINGPVPAAPRGGEGTFVSGAYAYGHIPESYRLYDMDRLSKLFVVQRGLTKFMHYLQSEIGFKSKRVSTFEYRTQEINELTYEFPVAENTDVTDPSNCVLKVSNQFGRNVVKQNDLLVVRDLFYEPTNTVKYSNAYGKSGSEFFTRNEVLFVLSIDSPDAAGTGFTYIRVRRGYTGTWEFPDYSDTTGSLQGAPTTPAPITTDTILMKAGNAFAHGTGAPTGDYAHPYMDGNYVQELKWAVEWVKEQELERTFLTQQGYTPMKLHTMLKMKQIAWDHERLVLFGRKSKTMNADGNPVLTMGGINEFIKRDDDHILDFSALTGATTINYIDINKWLTNVHLVGGADRKVGVTGYSLLTRLQNAFYNMHMFLNEERTKRFNIPVFKLVGAAGEMDLIHTYGMERAGWGERLMTLDLSVPAFQKVVFSGSFISGGKQVTGDFDMWKEEGIQHKGEMVEKTQYISMIGLERRAQQYHTVTGNFPQQVSRENTFRNA